MRIFLLIIFSVIVMGCATTVEHKTTVQDKLVFSHVSPQPENLKEGNQVEIHVVAERNALGVLHTYLVEGSNVNKKNDKGYTALLVAAMLDHDDVVKSLLDIGLDVNIAEESTGVTPLFFAVRNKNHIIAKRFLSHGANPNQKDIQGQTALIYAVEKTDLNIIRTLLIYGADVNAESLSGATPLMAAARTVLFF